jgi:hypothetical protein
VVPLWVVSLRVPSSSLPLRSAVLLVYSGLVDYTWPIRGTPWGPLFGLPPRCRGTFTPTRTRNRPIESLRACEFGLPDVCGPLIRRLCRGAVSGKNENIVGRQAVRGRPALSSWTKYRLAVRGTDVGGNVLPPSVLSVKRCINGQPLFLAVKRRRRTVHQAHGNLSLRGSTTPKPRERCRCYQSGLFLPV